MIVGNSNTIWRPTGCSVLIWYRVRHVNVEVAGIYHVSVGGSCVLFPPLDRLISRERGGIDRCEKETETRMRGGARVEGGVMFL